MGDVTVYGPYVRPQKGRVCRKFKLTEVTDESNTSHSWLKPKRKLKKHIIEEAEEIYYAIIKTMNEMETDHCQSWWLNKNNFDLKSKLFTSKINRRARLLVRQGYLQINKSLTSTSTGTCYKLTEKIFPK